MGCNNSTTAGGAIGGQKPQHIPSSSKGPTETNVSAERRIMQNFLLVWLDANIDESSDDFQNSITQLRRNVNTVEIFTDADQCIDYLVKIKDESALMIVSGALGQHTVPRIHDLFQINTIFVLCGNEVHHEQWANEWSKVQGVFTEMGPICEAMEQAARQCDQDAISISFVSADEPSNQNLDQLDQSFMYTQILKEILLELDYDEQSIKDLCVYCSDNYAENASEVDIIAEFGRNYRHKPPIWWYTYECFLYSMLNRALRTQEVDTIIKMGFFIRDLHRHIEDLHSQQFCDQQVPFIVYRGQTLSTENFEKLMKTKDGLISFNNFLSTSKKREVFLDFATRASMNPNAVGVLFKMTVDPSISSGPFALVDGVSYYQAEEEIIFSMHAVFRIGEVKKLDESNRLWLVELQLISDNDPLLTALTAHIREETQGGSLGWERLSKFLIKVGEVDKAEQVYQVLLDQTISNENETANYYHHLGCLKNDQGDFVAAILFYEKSIEIKEKTLSPNHPSLATSYNNIGLAFDRSGEYSKALSFLEKALEIDQETLPPNHPDLANSYGNIGLLYKNMGEYSKALSFLEKTLEINEKTLPPNHLDLATSYNNIGFVYDNMREYSKALSFYERAFEIWQQSLPSNHTNLQTVQGNMEIVRKKL